MRTYSFCCTTVTKGQIAQILLLHVTKTGPDGEFTPRNSKNTKHMQISLWLLDGHGRRKDFFQWGHYGFFPKFFQEGPKVVKFDFSHLKLRKQLFC